MIRGLSTPRLLVLSFAAVITAGTLLLLLPPSFVQGAEPLSVVDALFTATSAVCVTGLVVRDTGHEFSFFGQIIILLLIQAGGLGILTFSNSIIMARSRAVGLRERAIMGETVGLHAAISPGTLLLRVFAFTFICEIIGAVILTARFSRDFPFTEALWLGVFHAVSAFCNAGFGLFSDSLVAYRSDLVINFTIMGLVILGGLGFVVAADLTTSLRARRGDVMKRRLSFHSRVVLRTTAFLLVSGWGIFFLLQILGPSEASYSELLLETLFLSVTARTAGFNTFDIVQLSNAGILVLMMLMFIGGSPGSTAGGIKTTTIATIYALLRSRAANRPRVELLDRSIPHEIQGKALASAVGYVMVALAATILLEIVEDGWRTHAVSAGTFLPHLFEVISALATVGLSTGITAEFSQPGKVILVICMFIGRLGTVMVAGSLVGQKRRLDYTYPEERLMVA